MPSASDYVVDDSTKRLMELTFTGERNEDTIDEIINLVNEKAPKVFEGLADCNKVAIAKTLCLKCFQRDEVIFRQGDWPDAYYTVIRGAVSLYAHSSNPDDSEDSNERRYVFCTS
jgi:CRP-like cAMP-binding protein